MKILGLTGGSGTGKSTVSELLQARGAGAVDADAVYRDLCATSAPMLRALADAFGDVLLPSGALNRPALAAIVFADPAQLARLNEITTPYLREASIRAISALSAHKIVLYDAPTLFETGADALCEEVIGVLAEHALRVRRVMTRDGITERAARARIDAQPPDEFYRARCRYLVENNDDHAALARRVDRLYKEITGGL